MTSPITTIFLLASSFVIEFQRKDHQSLKDLYLQCNRTN